MTKMNCYKRNVVLLLVTLWLTGSGLGAYAAELGDIAPDDEPPSEIETELGGEFIDLFPKADFTPVPIIPDGKIIESSENQYGMQFYVIQTVDEHTYFLVVQDSSVYLLDRVNNTDLTSLLEAEYTARLEAQAGSLVPGTEAPATTVKPKPSDDETKDDSFMDRYGQYIIVGVCALGLFGVLYYIKIIKPKKNKSRFAPLNGAEDEDEDDLFRSDYDEPAGADDYEDEEEDPEPPVRKPVKKTVPAFEPIPDPAPAPVPKPKPVPTRKPVPIQEAEEMTDEEDVLFPEDDE